MQNSNFSLRQWATGFLEGWSIDWEILGLFYGGSNFNTKAIQSQLPGTEQSK